jgi:hypothetical protein
MTLNKHHTIQYRDIQHINNEQPGHNGTATFKKC